MKTIWQRDLTKWSDRPFLIVPTFITFKTVYRFYQLPILLKVQLKILGLVRNQCFRWVLRSSTINYDRLRSESFRNGNMFVDWFKTNEKGGYFLFFFFRFLLKSLNWLIFLKNFLQLGGKWWNYLWVGSIPTDHIYHMCWSF